MVTHVKIVLLCCSGGPSSVVILGGSATSSGSIPSIPNSRKASASATPHPPPAPTNYDCLERVSLTGSVGGCGAPAEDQLTSSQPHHHHVIQQQQIQPDNLSQKSGSTATTRRATHRYIMNDTHLTLTLILHIFLDPSFSATFLSWLGVTGILIRFLADLFKISHYIGGLLENPVPENF